MNFRIFWNFWCVEILFLDVTYLGKDMNQIISQLQTKSIMISFLIKITIILLKSAIIF